MAFCTECGASVPDGIKFCTECGSPMGETLTAPVMAVVADNEAAGGIKAQGGSSAAPHYQAPAVSAAPITPAQAVCAPQAAYAPHQAAPPPQTYTGYAQPPAGAAFINDAPPKGSKYAVMSTGSYILHSLLFAIPFVGWLTCVVMAFAAGNLNKRNYARAVLVFFVIGLIISAAAYFVISWALEAAIGYINEAAQDTLGELGGLGELLEVIK